MTYDAETCCKYSNDLHTEFGRIEKGDTIRVTESNITVEYEFINLTQTALVKMKITEYEASNSGNVGYLSGSNVQFGKSAFKKKLREADSVVVE